MSRLPSQAHDIKPLSIKQQIFETLKQGYQLEIHSVKSPEEDKDSLESYSVGFADITVWFYKRNSQQSLEEARYVWDLLPPNPLQRHSLVDYLNAYTEQILEKHKQYCYYQQKYKKVEKIINRTQGLIETLREGFEKIAGAKEHGNSKDTGNIPDDIKFSMYLSSIENINGDTAGKKNGFAGYHLELGHKDKIVSSSIHDPNGKQVDFQNSKLELTFSPKEGSIFIHLYEDYKENREVQKVLVAKRNLDLFTNISEKYLNDMLNFNSEDAEVGADYDEIRFDLFYLKRIEGSIVTNNKKENEGMAEDLLKLNMAILIENFRQCDDLQRYYRILIKRKEHLEKKMKGIKIKSSEYKKKLTLMLFPFSDIITFNEKNVVVQKRTVKKQHQQRRTCNMF